MSPSTARTRLKNSPRQASILPVSAVTGLNRTSFITPLMLQLIRPAISMWLNCRITASRCSTRAGGICTSGAAGEVPRVDSGALTGSRSILETTYMFRITSITEFKSSIPMASFWPSGAVTAPATGSSVTPMAWPPMAVAMCSWWSISTVCSSLMLQVTL